MPDQLTVDTRENTSRLPSEMNMPNALGSRLSAFWSSVTTISCALVVIKVLGLMYVHPSGIRDWVFQ